MSICSNPSSVFSKPCSSMCPSSTEVQLSNVVATCSRMVVAYTPLGACTHKEETCTRMEGTCTHMEVACTQLGACIHKEETCTHMAVACIRKEETCTHMAVACTPLGACIRKEETCTHTAVACTPQEACTHTVATCVRKEGMGREMFSIFATQDPPLQLKCAEAAPQSQQTSQS
ncbi:hypothetical protein Mapa_012008 [Marchantia paleacea]|nr:hypothetical protein Mapa_012008 [Marchantia paleacea]